MIDELEKTEQDVKIISKDGELNEESKKKVLEIEAENLEKNMKKAS